MITTKPSMSIPRKSNGHNIWTISYKKGFKPACSDSTSNVDLPRQMLFDPSRHAEGWKPSEAASIIQRRSGNYEPPYWGFQDIQSLNSEYFVRKISFSSRRFELKEKVSMMMVELEDAAAPAVDKLEFIDELQRLGISYHFENKIKQMLSRIYMDKYFSKDNVLAKEKDLYTEALAFRLFRKHGFMVSQEAFDYFKDDDGKFNSKMKNDTKGLLQLCEACYTLAEGETSLEHAMEFTTLALQQKLDDNRIDEMTASTIRHTLELPFHWKADRPNSRSFIQAYEGRRSEDTNTIVLEFAKLDFNILQSTYQQELKLVSRWWERTGLIEKLPFARDRVVEGYYWAVGFLYEPEYGYYRIMITKSINFIALLDDIYDIYGTLEELQEFIRVIQGWDTETCERLPEYIQVFWSALNNFIDDPVNYVLKAQGFDITPYLRKSWADYSEMLFQEATWYHHGYTPTVEEYMKVSWLSVSGPVVLTHAFFLVANPIKEEAVQSLYKYHDIVWSSSMIFRVMDDKGTSPEEMKRGDVPKWIQCYMNETGASENEARQYLTCLIRETWKKMNKELYNNSAGFHANFIRSATGLARMSHNVYQDGDGYGGRSVKDNISTMIFQPIL